MAGDETRARAVLAEMQARLAQGPHAALGITGTANATDIRRAFLELTKTYHPTRFARMSVELQRLSNEVFLALRGAHDAIRAPRLPNARANPAAPPTGKLRNNNDASGVRPAVPDATPPRRVRMASPSPPPPEGSEIRSPARAPTPAGGIKIGNHHKPVTSTATATAKADEHNLQPVIEMLRQQQWDAARAALNTLALRAPQSTKIRALQAYARGREAQLDRRIDEARVELDQALQLDPDLQLAKTALAELFTRRR